MTGPGLVPTFLYYFVGTTAIVAFVLTRGLDNAAAIGNPYQIGIVVGALLGGLGAYFNSHNQIELPVKNRGAFLKQLNEALTAMGYQETEADDADQGVKIYQRPFPSGAFSGKLFVQIEGSQAAIAGRASSLRQLRKRLNAKP